MATTIHPRCGKTYPANNTHGHCGSCCRTFIGLASFDAHRVGEHGADRRCEIQPYAAYRDDGQIRYGHWQDDHGYWKHGKQLTETEKKRIWGT